MILADTYDAEGITGLLTSLTPCINIIALNLAHNEVQALARSQPCWSERIAAS